MAIGISSADEFRLMLADLGTPVTIAGTDGMGLASYDDQVLEGETGFASGAGAGTQKRGELIGRQIVVEVLTDDFPGGSLLIDAPAIVGGQQYLVRLALSQSHLGLNLTNLYLRKA